MCEKTQKRHTREARGSFFVNICTTSGWTKIKVTKVSESQTLIRAPGSCRGEKKPNWEADFRDFVPVAALATPTGCSGYTVAFCVYPSQLAEKNDCSERGNPQDKDPKTEGTILLDPGWKNTSVWGREAVALLHKTTKITRIIYSEILLLFMTIFLG